MLLSPGENHGVTGDQHSGEAEDVQ